jgi:hypothetical protein
LSLWWGPPTSLSSLRRMSSAWWRQVLNLGPSLRTCMCQFFSLPGRCTPHVYHYMRVSVIPVLEAGFSWAAAATQLPLLSPVNFCISGR